MIDNIKVFASNSFPIEGNSIRYSHSKSGVQRSNSKSV